MSDGGTATDLSAERFMELLEAHRSPVELEPEARGHYLGRRWAAG